MLFTLIACSRRTRITGELLSWVSILYLDRYLSILWWAEIFIYTVATRNSGTTIHLSLIYHSHTNQTDVFGCVGCLCTFQTSESVICRKILHCRLASSGSSLAGSSWSSLRVKSPWLVSQVGNKFSWTAGGLLSAAITNPISWHARHGVQVSRVLARAREGVSTMHSQPRNRIKNVHLAPGIKQLRWGFYITMPTFCLGSLVRSV